MLFEEIHVFSIHPKVYPLDNDFIITMKGLVPFLVGSLLSMAFIFYLRLRLAPKPISPNFIIAVVIPFVVAIGFGTIFSFLTLALRSGL